MARWKSGTRKLGNSRGFTMYLTEMVHDQRRVSDIKDSWIPFAWVFENSSNAAANFNLPEKLHPDFPEYRAGCIQSNLQ